MVVAAAFPLTLTSDVIGSVYAFSSPTLPLPAIDGSGLDTLAQAQAIIAGGFATAIPRHAIDYPSSPVRSTSVFATFGAVFDAAAIATLKTLAVSQSPKGRLPR